MEQIISADVVVVGFGAAGAATAISAADLGLSVAIIEKQAADGHTPSVRMSGGLTMAASDHDRASAYLDACAGGLTPPELSARWAERASSLRAWLERVCPDVKFQRIHGGEQQDLPGADAIDVLQLAGEASTWAGPRHINPLDNAAGFGHDLFTALSRAVYRRPEITVHFDRPGLRLKQDPGGVVRGVEAAVPGGGSQEFVGRKGVVLCTGGFEFDEEMKANFLRANNIHFYGNPASTGDGVRLAQSVGASLWHMNQMVGRGVANVPTADGTMTFLIRTDPGGYIITDGDGHRFMDEHRQAELAHTVYYDFLDYDGARRMFPRIPSYWFFDERRRQAAPLTPASIGLVSVGAYDWSIDNSKEIANGWISQGDTVVEAGVKAGLSADAVAQLTKTVDEYNAGCVTGVDSQGRPAESLVPLDQGPFYCLPLWPGGSNTSGGPRRDQDAKVLDPWGSPIPGLYAAGELGQVLGALYPADGANLSDAFCFGQLAAEAIANAV